MPKWRLMQTVGQPEPNPISPSSVAEDPVIEALRGVAALMVVVTHYAYMLNSKPSAWGFASTGVDLFFVLSGYVFAPYFFGKKLSVGPHLIRRFFRLYPLYVAALLLYVALKLPDGGAWRHFGVHLMMGHTLSSTDVAFYYNPAFWSLPAEVEYYLLMPLLAWLVVRTGFLGLLVGSIALHMALLAAADPGEPANSARAIAMVHTPGLLVEFLLGSAAYRAAQRHPGQASAWWRLCTGLGGLVVVGLAFALLIVTRVGQVPSLSLWVSGNIGLGAAVGYATVVSALVSLVRSVGAATRWWFLLMGQLSYGVYLFHNASPKLLATAGAPATGWLAMVLASALTLLIAWVAHHAIEHPFRHYGRRLSQRLERPKQATSSG
jgi:exopolysaccharide production protein ExoZ